MDKDDVNWKLRDYDDDTPVKIRVNGVIFDIGSINYDKQAEAIVFDVTNEMLAGNES
jgi:hypothetical protein